MKHRAGDTRVSTVQSDPVDARTASDRAFEPTGVPNLDEVLGGGLPSGSLVLLIGPPGSGKTTLAAQIAFDQARRGKRALILTALSEPTNKLIDHLRPFPFFDERLLGGNIQVLSLEQFFRGGLEATGDELARLVRSARTGAVVIDGLQGIPGAEGNTGTTRSFLYQLGTLLGIMGCLMIFTKEGEPHDPALYPEATTTDVILGMHYRLAGVREQRWLEVVKVRSAAPLQGLHALVLGSNGVEVYPRLEARTRAARRATATPYRPGELKKPDHGRTDAEVGAHAQPSAGFGDAGLDTLLNGGLTRATSTVVAGDLGTGKTSLALQFALEGLRRGEPVVWLSFRESRAQLLLKASFLGGDVLRSAMDPGGGLTLLEAPPVELLADLVADDLLSALDRSHAQRVVIDSLTELVHVISTNGDGARVDDYLTALLVALRSRGATSLFTSELPPAADGQSSRVVEHAVTIAENLLFLQQAPGEGRLRRLLSLRTLRFSRRNSGPHEFSIGPSPHGIRLLPPGAQGY